MAKRIKKLISLLMVTATVVASAPSAYVFAAEVDDTADTAEATDEETSSDDSAEQNETVLEDCEVVMDGAVGKSSS